MMLARPSPAQSAARLKCRPMPMLCTLVALVLSTGLLAQSPAAGSPPPPKPEEQELPVDAPPRGTPKPPTLDAAPALLRDPLATALLRKAAETQGSIVNGQAQRMQSFAGSFTLRENPAEGQASGGAAPKPEAHVRHELRFRRGPAGPLYRRSIAGVGEEPPLEHLLDLRRRWWRLGPEGTPPQRVGSQVEWRLERMALEEELARFRIWFEFAVLGNLLAPEWGHTLADSGKPEPFVGAAGSTPRPARRIACSLEGRRVELVLDAQNHRPLAVVVDAGTRRERMLLGGWSPLGPSGWLIPALATFELQGGRTLQLRLDPERPVAFDQPLALGIFRAPPVREPEATALLRRAAEVQGGLQEGQPLRIDRFHGVFSASVFTKDEGGKLRSRSATIEQWWQRGVRGPQTSLYRRSLKEGTEVTLHVVDAQGKAWLQPTPQAKAIALAESPDHVQELADLRSEIRRTERWFDLFLVGVLLDPEWGHELVGEGVPYKVNPRRPAVMVDRIRCVRDDETVELLLDPESLRPVAVVRPHPNPQRVEELRFQGSSPTGPLGAKMPVKVLFLQGGEPRLRIEFRRGSAPEFNGELDPALFRRPRS